MIRAKHGAAAILLAALSALPVLSSAGPTTEALADDPQWLALLHMRRGLTGTYHSEVDAEDFFLSGSDHDAAAELQATLEALQSRGVGPGSAWCRFPARAQFLAGHFSLQAPEGLQCAELDNWRAQFHSDEAVLVFPEPYMGNVASIFGHTFLRLDSADKRAHPVLLSKAMSYYADVASAGNTVSYIAKGLAGGFEGVIEVAPYFRKLRKYSDNEDRDIREYRLALTPAQIRLFIDHAWEVRGHSFHYFFLTENCSYRLIAMLDVVSPTHRVREVFNWDAMPVDTVTALRDNHLIAAEKYVPSNRKRFYEAVAALTPAQRAQLLALARGEVHDDDVEDLHVLSLAADYSAMRVRTDPAHAGVHGAQVNRLIRRQADSGQLPPVTVTQLQGSDPTVTGHRQMRAQAGFSHEEGHDFLQLGLRAAYHDFYDPQQAYQPATSLEVLDLRLRRDLADGDIGLERMRWFALGSYNSRDDFFKPQSWGFSLSRQRELIEGEPELLHVVDGYRGLALDCGEWLCHGEVIAGVLGGSALDLGWTARAGLRAGALYQHGPWSVSADISEQQYLAGEHRAVAGIALGAGYTLARDTALQASYQREDDGAGNREILMLSLRQFF